MNLDLQSLSSEPLVYMLLHSGAFVTVLGIIFFGVGLLFGYATWGRYKRQARELRGEAAAMKEEIAILKRKVGDQSVKAGVSIAIATDSIHMKAGDGISASAAVPAVTPETITTRDIRTSTTRTMRPPTKSHLPRPRGNAGGADAATSPGAETTKPATAQLNLGLAEPPPPARHSSPLAAIITSVPARKALEPAPDVPADIPELPVIDAVPVADPRLGLIYRAKPAHFDDLTALKGIAKVLEQRLHHLGIYTYAQIAGWNEEQVREISARLAFKDRIHRERWVEQAQQLMAAANAKQDADPGVPG